MGGVAERAAAADPAARRALVRALADRLGETERGPLALLARVVATLGEERARAFLAEVLATEAAGGLPLPDGSRRRSFPPGVRRRLPSGSGAAGGQATPPGATGRRRRGLEVPPAAGRRRGETPPDGAAR